jgi:sugar lactone lactonase YvrE
MRTAVLRLSVAALAFVLVIGTGAAQADVQIRTVVSFDPAEGGFPEGTVADVRGDVYVSRTSPVNEILRIGPNGQRSVVAHFDVGGFGPLGMAVDASGRLFVAIASFDPATRGIYRVEPDGSSTRLPGTRRMLFPNGLALDHDGTIYATDSIRGAVFRIRPGSVATVWVKDPVLAGNGSFGFGFPIGANGVVVGPRHQVVVSNTEGAKIVTIGTGSDGSAETPRVLTEGAGVYGADGIALDVFGRIYAALNVQDKLVRIGANGAVTTLATAADGLNTPASVSFGTSHGERKDLFVTNFATFSTEPHPGLLVADVGTPGPPVP